MLEPGCIDNLPETQVNEVEDDDHQKDGFVTDLEADADLSSVTRLRAFRTVNRE